MATASHSLSRGWALAAAAVFSLAALAASPSVLEPGAGAAVRQAFAVLCHQLPERTPHLGGEPLALCHRCSGVLAGLALGLVGAPLLRAGRLSAIAGSAQAGWLVAAAAPTALDWAVGVVGIWANTPVSRSLTGAVFGLAAGLILGANLLTPPERHAPALTPSSS